MPFKVTPEEKSELLVTFAALILNDDKVAITADNINKLINAAGAEVEPYLPKLFAGLLDGQDVNKLLLNSVGAPGSGGGGAAPAAAAGGAVPAAGKKEDVKEKEKEKEPEEEEADMGFSLFD